MLNDMSMTSSVPLNQFNESVQRAHPVLVIGVTMSALQAFKHSLFLFVWTAKVMRSQSHRQNIPSLSSKRYFSESPFVHIMLKFTQYAYMDTYTPTQTDIMDLFLLHWRIWLKSNKQFANMIKAKNISHYSHCYSDIQTHNSLAEDLPTFS